jgi:hypothetical protein
VKNEGQGPFMLKILDPSLRDQELFTSCLELIREKDCNDAGLSVTDVKSMVSKALDINGRQMTFGDLEGRTLTCKGTTRPYKRCLNFHASRARDYAMKQGWISSNVTFKYSWSGDFNENQMTKYLDTLGTSFDDPNVGSNVIGISDESLLNESIQDDDLESTTVSDIS